METVGGRINFIRKELGLNQTDFGVAINQNRLVVSRWESGVQVPHRMKLLSLCEITGIDPLWLIEGQGEPPRITRAMLDALKEHQGDPVVMNVPPTRRFLSSETDSRGRSQSRVLTSDILAPLEDFLHAYGQRVASLMEGYLAEYPAWPNIPGIDQETMLAFSQQRAVPSMRTMAVFAAAMGVREAWLLTGEDHLVKAQLPRPKLPAEGNEDPPSGVNR